MPSRPGSIRSLKRRLSLHFESEHTNSSDNGPFSAGLPTNNFLHQLSDSKHDYKRARYDHVSGTHILQSNTEIVRTPPNEIFFMPCEDLADILSSSTSCCSIGRCSHPLFVLDLRNIRAQTNSRIKTAIGMPCESRVKLRIALPALDSYIRTAMDKVCVHCQGFVKSSRSAILYTEMTSESALTTSSVIKNLITHLLNTYKIQARILKGGFHEFRRTYPHLCESTSRQNSFKMEVINGTELVAEKGSNKIKTTVEQDSRNLSNSENFESSVNSSLTHNSPSQFSHILLPGLNLTFIDCDARESKSLDRIDEELVSRAPKFSWNPGASFADVFLTDVDTVHRRDVFCIRASQILPFLYIGNETDVTNERILSALDIRAVLNVTTKVPFPDQTRFQCHRLPAVDVQTQDLRPLFSHAFEFIETARHSGHAVLVHCQAGVSRSPTLVIAYLMAHSKLSLGEAYQLVKSKRSVISPNFSFLGQLCDFEADLNSGHTTRKPEVLDTILTDLRARESEVRIQYAESKAMSLNPFDTHETDAKTNRSVQDSHI